MKNLFLITILALTSISAHARIIGAPFMPESDARFDALEKMQPSSFTGDITSSASGVTAIGAGKVLESNLVKPTASTSGLFPARVAKATWDPSGVSGQRTVAAHGLGVTIPANAIITRTWFYTKTSVVSTGNDGTIAFSCVAANDIFSAADIDASSGVAGQIGAGVSVGTAATMKYVTTACEITATVAVDAFTAGKIDIFAEYVIVGE